MIRRTILSSVCVAIILAPTASAFYIAPNQGKWCKNNVYVWNNAGSTQTYAAELGWRMWAASPLSTGQGTQVQLQQGGPSLHDITISTPATVAHPNWAAWTDGRTSGCYANVQIVINTLITGSYNLEKKINVVAHEMGHAMGLDHSDDPNAVTPEVDTLMVAGDIFSTRPYLAPVYDDLKGIQFIYTPIARSTFAHNDVLSGSITRDVSGNPTRTSITTAGAGNHAFASTTYQSIPSAVKAVVLTAEVTPNTLFRSSLCVCWTYNPSSPTTRMYDLEMNNDKFALTYSKSDGSLGVVPLKQGTSTPVPTAGTRYWLTLVIYNQDNAGTPYAYAYVHRTSNSDEVAHAGFVSGTKYRFDGTNTFAHGVGVWTDATGNPLSSTNYGPVWSGLN